MKEIKTWSLELDNFEGESYTLYFENYNIAKQNFDVICKKFKNYEEFEIINGTTCTWFDSSYNEYSTYITLKESIIKFYDHIIF